MRNLIDIEVPKDSVLIVLHRDDGSITLSLDPHAVFDAAAAWQKSVLDAAVNPLPITLVAEGA